MQYLQRGVGGGYIAVCLFVFKKTLIAYLFPNYFMCTGCPSWATEDNTVTLPGRKIDAPKVTLRLDQARTPAQDAPPAGKQRGDTLAMATFEP